MVSITAAVIRTSFQVLLLLLLIMRKLPQIKMTTTTMIWTCWMKKMLLNLVWWLSPCSNRRVSDDTCVWCYADVTLCLFSVTFHPCLSLCSSVVRMKASHIGLMFKLCLLVYKALHGLAPVYIKSMCVPVSSSMARSSLCSVSRGHLIVPRTRLEFGKRAFAFTGRTAWSSLPDIIRSTECINTFKRLLKSFLF